MSGVYILINVNKSSSEKLYVKIGCSANIERRIKQIEKSFKFNGSLDELKTYKIIECKEYRKLEKILHTACKSRQVTNEWFCIEEEFLIKRLSMIQLDRY